MRRLLSALPTETAHVRHLNMVWKHRPLLDRAVSHPHLLFGGPIPFLGYLWEGQVQSSFSSQRRHHRKRKKNQYKRKMP